jgi:hypothetical protein
MEPSSGQMGQLEKAITVYGQPENCTAACRRILEVMAEEAKNVGKDQEICLKILAHNNLIGRIIGKQGATIKKIMEVGTCWPSVYIGKYVPLCRRCHLGERE